MFCVELVISSYVSVILGDSVGEGKKYKLREVEKKNNDDDNNKKTNHRTLQYSQHNRPK